MYSLKRLSVNWQCGALINDKQSKQAFNIKLHTEFNIYFHHKTDSCHTAKETSDQVNGQSDCVL